MEKYELRILDILGKEKLNLAGGLNEINRKLTHAARSLYPGNYIIQVKNEGAHQSKTIQLVKVK